MFLASITVQILSVFMASPYDDILRFTGIGVVFAFAVKWFIVDSVIKSWTTYKEERQDMFNTIKDSHK